MGLRWSMSRVGGRIRCMRAIQRITSWSIIFGKSWKTLNNSNCLIYFITAPAQTEYLSKAFVFWRVIEATSLSLPFERFNTRVQILTPNRRHASIDFSCLNILHNNSLNSAFWPLFKIKFQVSMEFEWLIHCLIVILNIFRIFYWTNASNKFV